MDRFGPVEGAASSVMFLLLGREVSKDVATAGDAVDGSPLDLGLRLPKDKLRFIASVAAAARVVQ